MSRPLDPETQRRLDASVARMRGDESGQSDPAPPLAWMEPSAADRQRAQERAGRASLPSVALRHIDIPFEDVLATVFKIVVAQVIIGAPLAFVIWLAFLR